MPVSATLKVKRRSVAAQRLRGGHQPYRAGGGEFDGVAQEVEQHLAQAAGVERHLRRQLLDSGQVELQPFGLGLRPHRLDQRLEEGGGVDRLRVELEVAGGDFFEVEHVAHQGQQVLAAGAQVLDVAPLVAVERGAFEQAGQADHPVERSAQLVAHVGQEAALDLIGLLGLFAGPAGVRLGAAQAGGAFFDQGLERRLAGPLARLAAVEQQGQEAAPGERVAGERPFGQPGRRLHLESELERQAGPPLASLASTRKR